MLLGLASASCGSFGTAPAAGTPEENVPANDGGDARAPDGAGPTQPGRFCAAHAQALLCDDFEDGYDGRWTKLPNATFMKLEPAGADRGTAAQIVVAGQTWTAGTFGQDGVSRIIGPATGAFTLSFALRVDEILQNQRVELATFGAGELYVHIILEDRAVKVVEWDVDTQTYVSKNVVAPLTIGKWQRVRLGVTYATRNRFSAEVEGAPAFQSDFTTRPTERFGELRVDLGILISYYAGEPTRYLLDDVVVTSAPD